MRNVAGEILGSETAIDYAIQHDYKAIYIYYDYEGIEKWANGIWKANKTGTKAYQENIKEKRNKIVIESDGVMETVQLRDTSKSENEWIIDTDIPIFKGEGREYIDKLVYVGEE